MTIDNPFLDDEDEPWQREYTAEQRTEMKRLKAAGDLLPGHKRRKSTYSRRDLTKIDFRLMRHIGVHKGCSSSIAGVLLSVTERTAHRRLLGLRELRLVDRHEVPGCRMFWYLTPKGKELLVMAGTATEDDLTVGRPDAFDLAAMGHTLAVSMTAAQLSVKAADPEQLIGETAIRRTWSRASEPFATKKELYGKGYAGEQLKRAVLLKLKKGELTWEQAMASTPALWTLTARLEQPMTMMQFHHPDFVIDCEAGRTGSRPQSIAVEVELTTKKDSEYERILRTYAKDPFVYSKVIWVVRSKAMQQKIEQAAAKVGLPAEKLGFDLLRDATGAPFGGFPWTL